MYSLILVYLDKLVHTRRHTSTSDTNCTMTPKAHMHTHTGAQLEKPGMWNTKQSEWDNRRHRLTRPDSKSNGVDEVRWKSLYVSVSLSVSALITQEAAQYPSLTLSLSARLILSTSSLPFSLCSTPLPSITNQLTAIKRMGKKPCLSTCVNVCVSTALWE